MNNPPIFCASAMQLVPMSNTPLPIRMANVDPGNDRRGLTVPERLLLFCLASKTDWQKVPGLTHATAQRMTVQGLIEPERTGTSLVLSPQGRAVFAALIANR